MTIPTQLQQPVFSRILSLNPIQAKKVILPTEIMPAEFVEPTSMLIYGMPKIGKTYSVIQLPNTLIIALQRGADHHACRRISANSFSDYMDIISAVKTEGKYDYVVVDTIGDLEELCAAEANRRYKTSSVGSTFRGTDILNELDRGAGYRWLRNAFDEALKATFKCAPRIIFLGHVRDKSVDTGGGEEVIMKDIDLTGKCKNMACSQCDVIAHMFRVKRAGTKIADTCLATTTNDTLNAGCIFPWLSNKTIKIIDGETLKCEWSEVFPSLKPPTL